VVQDAGGSPEIETEWAPGNIVATGPEIPRTRGLYLVDVASSYSLCSKFEAEPIARAVAPGDGRAFRTSFHKRVTS
jgi:hypothetical protein